MGALAAFAFLPILLTVLPVGARASPGTAAAPTGSTEATSTSAMGTMGARRERSGRAPAPACSWDHPGRDAFTGDVPSAVDRYTDLAPDLRERLKARMRAHDYDDIVEISRDRIAGKAGYEPQIRDMHFGAGPGRVCATVSRERWSDAQRERALVYCEGQTCVMVPTVCRNVSRIARVAGGGPGAGEGELPFDPPGAGAPTPVPESVPLTLAPTPLPETLPGVPLVPPTALAVPPSLSISPPGGPPVAGLPPPPLYTLPPGVGTPIDPPVTTPIAPPVVPPIAPPIAPVPEPSSPAMTAAGLALLAVAARRVRRRAPS
ncbi:MHFG family PEP-CTERM protein [Roseateles chitosanitabidus]|uniref:MHFG family PEP-CTERM protein n=1 Tax=Roseateles chitosanitabidus TaxID=65048 RepID=UPI00082CA399|nr:MHFG family PEP-CTERM protein [Roseateles chitosanitabidus]